MSLRLPSEIVVDRFLPTARSMLARALADRDLTQQAIADRLGVTQAAVSQYLGEGGAEDDRLRDDPRMRQTVERIADGFADGSLGDYEALAELLELIQRLEDRGPICAIHESEMPALEGLGCDLCIRGTDAAVAEERAVLTAVRAAVRTLSALPGIARFVPHVGTNVVMALPGADDPADVAALPGRIHRMHEGITAPRDPEFGGSRHVATTVLAAMAVDPAKRGAINLATDTDLLGAARDLGFEPLAFEAGYEGRRERLERAFEDRSSVPAVAYHEGGLGVEPITYLVADSAVEAAELAGGLLAEIEPD